MSLLIPPPKKFVGFHGHTGFSVFDGLGYPSDHIDFVLENGMDAERARQIAKGEQR